MCILEHEYETFCLSSRLLRRNYNFDFLEELLGKGKFFVREKQPICAQQCRSLAQSDDQPVKILRVRDSEKKGPPSKGPLR